MERITKQAHEESWNNLLYEIEDDMHGKQLISYKLIVYLKRSEKHIAKLNVILKINEKNTIPVFNAVNKYELTNTF